MSKRPESYELVATDYARYRRLCQLTGINLNVKDFTEKEYENAVKDFEDAARSRQKRPVDGR